MRRLIVLFMLRSRVLPAWRRGHSSFHDSAYPVDHRRIDWRGYVGVHRAGWRHHYVLGHWISERLNFLLPIVRGVSRGLS